MKSTNTVWATAMAAFALLFAIPSLASADHDHGRRCHGCCNHCGVSLYSNHVIVGYDRCGHPIYSWVPVSHSCMTRSQPRYGYSYGSSYGSFGRPVYRNPSYYSRGGCPDRIVTYPQCPPSRGGFSISFGF
jgi:hypothetical protein